MKLFRNQFHFLNRIVVGVLLLFNLPQKKRGASTTQVQGMEEGKRGISFDIYWFKGWKMV